VALVSSYSVNVAIHFVFVCLMVLYGSKGVKCQKCRELPGGYFLLKGSYTQEKCLNVRYGDCLLVGFDQRDAIAFCDVDGLPVEFSDCGPRFEFGGGFGDRLGGHLQNGLRSPGRTANYFGSGIGLYFGPWKTA